MRRLRSIIVDDEETGIDTLKLLIEKHVDDVKVVAQTTLASEAIELIENYMPEIVFLDISMPEMDGFELLEKLAWRDFDLVFTTAHQEFGLRALKLNAVDYLLKPVDHRELRLTVNKIWHRLISRQEGSNEGEYDSLNNVHKHHTARLAVHSKEGIEFIDAREIISMESLSNYTKIHLMGSGAIVSPKTLGLFDKELCENNQNFMRVHHSFIINLHNILRVERDNDRIVMTDSQKIPLARSRREAFFRWLKII